MLAVCVTQERLVCPPSDGRVARRGAASFDAQMTMTLASVRHQGTGAMVPCC